MGTMVAGRMGWWRGSDGMPEKAQRDVQPVAHKKDERCDLGSGADVDRLPASGQFACATGCTTRRNQPLPTTPVSVPLPNKF